MTDISTFIGATAPMAETGLKVVTPTAPNSEAGDFIHLLETILNEVELQDQETGDITQSATWLGTLLHVFSQYSFGEISTPDSSGEASTSTEAGLSVSLTELMTALQTVPSQEDIPQLQEDLSPDLGFLIESQTNPETEQILTIVRDQPAEVLDPAALSSLQSLLTGHLPFTPTSNSQAISGNQASAGQSTPTLTGFVELAADTLPSNNANVTITEQPAQPTTGTGLPLKGEPVEAVFDTLVAKAETYSSAATGQAKAEADGATFSSPTTPTAEKPTAAVAFRPLIETGSEAPFQPQPKAQGPAEVVPVQQPVTTAATPLTIVTESKPVDGPTLPNIPALQQIVDTVELITNRGETSVRLQLHPETLGKVTIQLHTANGDVAMRVLTETAQAQTLLREHLPELKAAFATQGLQLSHLTVDVGSDTSTFDQPGQGTNGRPFEWADEHHSAPSKKASASVDSIRSHWSPNRGLNSVNYQV